MKKIEMTYAMIESGIVQNIIVADAAFAALIAADYDAVVEATGTAAYIGGEYRDGAFVPMPPPVEPAAP